MTQPHADRTDPQATAARGATITRTAIVAYVDTPTAYESANVDKIRCTWCQVYLGLYSGDGTGNPNNWAGYWKIEAPADPAFTPWCDTHGDWIGLVGFASTQKMHPELIRR